MPVVFVFSFVSLHLETLEPLICFSSIIYNFRLGMFCSRLLRSAGMSYIYKSQTSSVFHCGLAQDMPTKNQRMNLSCVSD